MCNYVCKYVYFKGILMKANWNNTSDSLARNKNPARAYLKNIFDTVWLGRKV